ncbi:MAG TPA: hypothetical protein VM925_20080 [Labilithrix sp.]|nr:hypothetical protein [Labilithrix sp.]
MKSLTAVAFGTSSVFLVTIASGATTASKIHELPTKAEPAVMVSASGHAVVSFNTRSDANELAGHAVSIDPNGGVVELPGFAEAGLVNGGGFVDLTTWSAFDMYGGTGWIATDGTAAGTRKGVWATDVGNAFPFEDRVVVADTLYTRTSETSLQLPADTTAVPCGSHLYGFQKARDSGYNQDYFRLLRLNTDGTSAGEVFPGRRVRWSTLQYDLPSTGTWARTHLSCLAGELFVEVFNSFKLDKDLVVPADPEWWRPSNPPARVGGRVDALAGTVPLQLVAAEGIVTLTATGSTLLKAVPSGQARWFIASSASFAYFQIEGELWRTDGTAAGTVRIDATTPFDGRIESAVSAGDRTFFRVERNGYQTEIWETDGTPSGTKLVPLPEEPKGDALYLDKVAKRLVLDDKQLWFLRRTTPDTYAVYRIEVPRPVVGRDGGPDEGTDAGANGQPPGNEGAPSVSGNGGDKAASSSEGSGCTTVPVAGRMTPAVGMLTGLLAFARRRRRRT